MPDALNALFDRRDALQSNQRLAVEKLDERIYALLALRWSGWKALAEALAQLDTKPDGYGLGEDGSVEAWKRFDLSDISERERPYLDDYLLDTDGCVRADYRNDVLLRAEGPSILVNLSPRRGEVPVFDQDSMKSVELDDFTDTDGDIDEERLAWLLEAWMEANGYFPGVFDCDDHGNVSPFETVERAKRYAARVAAQPVTADEEEA